MIYLAGPCGGTTAGGMYQVSLYLKQASEGLEQGAAELRLLDTRGPGHAFWSAFYILLAAMKIVRARSAGRLAGVHIHVAERLSLVRKGFLVGVCRAIGTPVILHLHAAEIEANYAALPHWSKRLVRWMFRMPDCSIALGQGAARFLAFELGVPRAQIEVVTNGVPEPMVTRAAAPSSGCFKLLFVGVLSERKGVSVLLQAMAHPKLRDLPVQLTLAGRGDIALYTTMAQELGVGDRVTFTGWATKASIDRLLAATDAFVLPSFHEGLPLAILEALALGVPTVCTPVGEIPHALEHGRSAYFVPPGEHEPLAEALVKLYQEPALRSTLSQEGLAAYRSRFSLAVFAKAIASIHVRHFAMSSLRRNGLGADPRVDTSSHDGPWAEVNLMV